jgi:hypothetical protein
MTRTRKIEGDEEVQVLEPHPTVLPQVRMDRLRKLAERAAQVGQPAAEMRALAAARAGATVGAPILPIPGLLFTSAVRVVRSLVGAQGDDPTAGRPGILDLPRVVGENLDQGVKRIGDGITDAGNGAVSVVAALFGGVAAIGKGVGDGMASASERLDTDLGRQPIDRLEPDAAGAL